jgi:hypothetical protein
MADMEIDTEPMVKQMYKACFNLAIATLTSLWATRTKNSLIYFLKYEAIN